MPLISGLALGAAYTVLGAGWLTLKSNAPYSTSRLDAFGRLAVVRGSVWRRLRLWGKYPTRYSLGMDCASNRPTVSHWCLAEGVFDSAGFEGTTKGLVGFIESAAQAYNLHGDRIVSVGYSNGANIASSAFFSRIHTFWQELSYSGP